MGELFGPWVPSEMIEGVLDVVRSCPQHRFYFLTKYPERLPEFNPWPENAWIGATATDRQTALHAMSCLSYVEALVKYLSLEPLLESIATVMAVYGTDGISWVITGPLNGKLARQHPCNPRWLDEVAVVCVAGGVSLYEKPECARILDRSLIQEWPRKDAR